MNLVDVDILAVAAAVERLEQRVAALEASLATRTERSDVSALHASLIRDAVSESRTAGAGWAEEAAAPGVGLGAVTFTGRTLVVLGGAYLLRALTEAHVIPIAAGAAAAFIYALIWAAQSVRAATKGARTSAAFHGLSASLVGFPLVWEIVGRFALVEPGSGALILTIFTAVLLIGARRSTLQSVAWFATLGAIGTSLVLAVTVAAMPYAIVLIALGIATLWLGYLNDWVGLRWPAAAAADLMVGIVTIQALYPGANTARPAMALQLSMLAVYLGSVVARTWFLGREVIPFEVVQTAAAVAVGFGGALVVLAESGASAVPVGVAAAVLGAAAYGFAFAFVEPRKHWRNLAFFTSLAVAFSLTGVVIVVRPPVAVFVLAALALFCAEWARRSARLTLAVHAFIFAIAMAWLSGLLGTATVAIVAPAADALPRLDFSMLLALATIAACVRWPAAEPRMPHDLTGIRVLRVSRLALLLWTVGGVAIALVASLVTVPGSLSPENAGTLAAIRTGLLAALACALMAAPGRADRLERTWTGYAMLVVIGMKVLVEDLPHGRPVTLFVALAAFGAALILAPRLARRSGD